jgi:hypothetical protein
VDRVERRRLDKEHMAGYWFCPLATPLKAQEKTLNLLENVLMACKATARRR